MRPYINPGRELSQGIVQQRLAAQKHHIAAHKAANARKASYASLMQEHGYKVDIDHRDLETLGQKYTQWNIIIWSKERAEVILRTTFLDDMKTSACAMLLSGECPTLAELPEAERELARRWRCQVRWMDVVSCPEGLMTAVPDANPVSGMIESKAPQLEG